MSRAIIISDSKKESDHFSKILEKCCIDKIDTASKKDLSFTVMSEAEPDLLVLSLSENINDSSLLLLNEIADRTAVCIIILCSTKLYENVCETSEPHGICILKEDAPDDLIFHSARLLLSQRTRLLKAMNRSEALLTEINESKIINRAKCVLIQYLKLTEAQAHKYIEKQAMDTRRSKLEVARSILITYES